MKSTHSFSPSIAGLVASLFSMRTVGNPSRTLNRNNPAQQRRVGAWLAGAEKRAEVRREIALWNAGVKRRNQRFVARQLARGRVAA